MTETDNGEIRRHRSTESNNREYLEALIKGNADLDAERWKGHDREHEWAQRAVDLAANLVESNKQDTNEWRKTFSDRDRNYATKGDVLSAETRLEVLERADIRRAENEQTKAKGDADDKTDDDRRQRNQQWFVGIVAVVGSVVINLLIRLISTSP